MGTTAAAGLSLGGPAAAADATWVGGDDNWNSGINWSTGATPGGNNVATFDTGFSTSVTIDAPATSIGTMQFSPTADSYVFFINNSFGVTGGGILNGSSSVQTYVIFGALSFAGGTTTGPVELDNLGALSYADASAGSASIFNSGTVDFNAGGSAGSATISNNGFATINFNGASTAGNAAITNNGFGIINFNSDGKAGTARIDNLRGSVSFNDTSTADHATIVNNGFGSNITFNGTSTAGSATITNTGGFVIFRDNASAGNANISNDPSSAQFRAIEFNNSSTAGNATITTANGAKVDFFDSSTGGTATLVADNGGAVRFFDSASGDQARLVSNAGGSIEINALATTGTTAGSIEGAGRLRLGGKTLTVGHNDLSTMFSGSIQGNGGALVKLGNGTLILSGTANTYTGATTVNGGLLQVDGSITTSGLVTVNAGGTLGGTGTVGSTVINGGALAPGDSIGTLKVQGNLVLSSAASYLVQISPSSSDRTNVTGTATLGGGVQVAATPGSYTPGTSYTILSAAGGVNGTFATVMSNFGSVFLTPTLSYTPTAVLLTLTQLPFNSVAQTSNQTAIADALQAGGVTGGLGKAAFNLSTAEQARAAFGALSGEVHASLRSTLLDDSSYLRNAVLGRLRATSYSDAGGELAPLRYGGPALAYAADDKEQRAAFPGADATQGEGAGAGAHLLGAGLRGAGPDRRQL